MLSSKASQNVTYHCFYSVAYKNAKRGHMRQAIELMSSNDLELRHRGKFRYSVIKDECQHKRRQCSQTVVSVKNTKPARLPIVDVAMKDIGKRGEKFKLEIGPVCYS
jgi:hypothetical protein